MQALNQDQQAAFQDVIEFLNDPSRKMHRISGGPGTGKSFFIEAIAKDVLRHQSPKTCNTVAVTATTNKAAAVLKRSLMYVPTTYSFMNLRLMNDYTRGTQKIVPHAAWKIHSHTLLIVDESSMVSKALWDYLNKGTDSSCKIIFVGDKDQLDPVKEYTSPVYTTPMSESLLKTPIRNSTQAALMDTVEKARQTVLTGKFFKIDHVPGVIDHINGAQTQGIIERLYDKETAHRRILCYTNQRALAYNTFVRQIRGYTEPYSIGEILSNNESAEIMDRTRLYSDQIVEVMDRGIPYENDTLVPGHPVLVLDLVVQDVETEVKYEVTVFADPQDRKNVMAYLSKQKQWDKFFRVKERFPDLRPIAASTTHKAQGSTYEDVLVDLTDIGKATQIDLAARLLYVALSRPKHRLFIRGELPERFFK